MAMSKYETIMWEKEMKEQVLVHARAIFVEKYPRGSVFDVIHGITHEIEETESFAGGAYYNTHLVVYKDPGTTEKYKLVISVLDRQNVAEGLEHLLKELRRRVGFEIHLDREHKEKE